MVPNRLGRRLHLLSPDVLDAIHAWRTGPTMSKQVDWVGLEAFAETFGFAAGAGPIVFSE
jgi:hypothetical protein